MPTSGANTTGHGHAASPSAVCACSHENASRLRHLVRVRVSVRVRLRVRLWARLRVRGWVQVEPRHASAARIALSCSRREQWRRWWCCPSAVSASSAGSSSSSTKGSLDIHGADIPAHARSGLRAGRGPPSHESEKRADACRAVATTAGAALPVRRMRPHDDSRLDLRVLVGGFARWPPRARAARAVLARLATRDGTGECVYARRHAQ